MGRPAAPPKSKRQTSKLAKDPTKSIKEGRIAKPPQPRQKKHAEYRQHALRSKLVQCLEYQCHDTRQLVEDAINSFCSDDLTKLQRDAIRSFMTGIVGCSSPSQGVGGAMQQMSEIFFLDKLNNINLRWVKDLSRLSRRYGDCNIEWTTPPTVVIRMDPEDFHMAMGVQNHGSSLMSTLLHECCHAFVNLYSCTGGCWGLACNTSQSVNLGDTGHAKGWFMLAASVQLVARKVFPGLDIRLDVFNAGILYEHRESTYLPGEEEWKFLFKTFSSEDMWDLFSELDSDDWKRLKKAYHRQSLVFDMIVGAWKAMRAQLLMKRGARFTLKEEAEKA